MSPVLSRLIGLLPLASLGALLAGCPNVPADPLPSPQGTIDLALALGVEDPQVIGVTVNPDDGTRYLLDRVAGLFELADDGTATLLREIETFPTPAVLPRSLWTDFVSLGHGQFAITALSDGYLLDLEADTLTEYFCYVPDMDIPDDGQPILDQLTNSVAFDPNSNVLYAQPITFEADSTQAVVSQAASIGAYSIDGGQPIAWFDLADIDFLAIDQRCARAGAPGCAVCHHAPGCAPCCAPGCHTARKCGQKPTPRGSHKFISNGRARSE